MTPTEEASCLGAKPLGDMLDFNAGGFFSTEYTGFGCLVGDYAPAGPVQFQFVNGDALFRVRTTRREDKQSSVEWSGLIRGNRIMGEVRFITSGDASNRTDVERAASQVWGRQVARLFNGRLDSVPEELLGQLRGQDAQLRHKLLCPGHEVVYTFRGTLAHAYIPEPPPPGNGPRVRP
jgi:hypothetical protein